MNFNDLMDTVLNFRNTTINTSHNIKTVCKKRNLSFECFRNIRMSKEHLKVSARLQRSCNRQDVLLLNNSFLLLYTRDSLAVMLEG